MKYKYSPETKEELIKAIKKEIYEVQGTPDNPNWKADLNCIDVSQITDMNFLFSGDELKEIYGLSEFDGDISKWNVSNVEDMSWMFYRSRFNGDISKWDVSNVKNMKGMFVRSDFNGDLSEWDVSNVKDMSSMFGSAKFNGDISKWNVSKVEYVSYMFCCGSNFRGDIGCWDMDDTKKANLGLNNVSAKRDYKKLPDKIVSPKTLSRALLNGKNPVEEIKKRLSPGLKSYIALISLAGYNEFEELIDLEKEIAKFLKIRVDKKKIAKYADILGFSVNSPNDLRKIYKRVKKDDDFAMVAAIIATGRFKENLVKFLKKNRAPSADKEISM